MKRFFVKGTDIIVRESARNYVCAVAYVREDSSMIIYSCHSSFDNALKSIRHLKADFARHPNDFNLGYDPSRLVVVDLDFYDPDKV